jgi:hypothetical protein
MPEDYECFKGMTLKDCPKEFIHRVGHPQPYQGLAIDCEEGAAFKRAENYIKTVPES